MTWNPDYRPQLRLVEPFVLPSNEVSGDGGEPMIGLRDPSGLSKAVLTMSEPALALLALMDGEHSCAEIRDEFFARHGQPVSVSTLADVLGHLSEAHFLEDDRFRVLYERKLTAYRHGGVREMPHAEAIGLSSDAGTYLEEILRRAEPAVVSADVCGIVAPHLDYPRGEPCYAAAYGSLVGRCAPDRVVILGTNHFGQSTSVVATGNDFETPLGRTPADVAFLAALETRCGDLRRSELDHVREHSVELQVAFLQHLFGPEAFTIVPLLCPDPINCGEQNAANNRSGGLQGCAQVLKEMLRDDPADTLLVAGADLSHVGQHFGDERLLDDSFLAKIRQRDSLTLQTLINGTAGDFVASVARHNNPTRICSAGCVSVLAAVLADDRPHLLAYHQAVDQQTQSCVTCAAVAYTLVR